MQVKVTTAFNDQTIEDGEKRRAIGAEFEASDERAGYLENLGYVEKVSPAIPAEIVQPISIPVAPVPAPAVPAAPLADLEAGGEPVPPVAPAGPAADFHVAQN